MKKTIYLLLVASLLFTGMITIGSTAPVVTITSATPVVLPDWYYAQDCSYSATDYFYTWSSNTPMYRFQLHEFVTPWSFDSNGELACYTEL